MPDTYSGWRRARGLHEARGAMVVGAALRGVSYTTVSGTQQQAICAEHDCRPPHYRAKTNAHSKITNVITCNVARTACQRAKRSSSGDKRPSSSGVLPTRSMTGAA